MKYHIACPDPSSRFIHMKWTIPQVHQDTLHIQLPSWRPGRYELQNYAKNIRRFSVADKNGGPVSYFKTSKDRWEIDARNIDELVVTYEYYANQPDAGASYLCNDYLYINPVNCFMYAEGRADEEYTLTFDLPSAYIIATQMPVEGHTAVARNFDYLADSPLIAGAMLEHHEVKIPSSGTDIHFWFQGRHPFDAERLKADTVIYAEKQIALFGEMPCKAYHFLYLMHEAPFRHGVEHLDSTVIAMGQLEGQTTEEYYHDLLAISSHEMFHLWNIKRIRPADMLPYDFTKENYSTLGYVYEGITTYYGDLMLLRSGVWNLEQYISSLNSDLLRHFTNEGRDNYSVAESSWDTWLDGYVPGIPGRKVSIYIEGLMAAMVADLTILKNTGGKHRLDDVLRDLYRESLHGKGYTEASYRQLLEKYAGVSFDEYFRKAIWGKGQLEQLLRDALQDIGCTLDAAKAAVGLTENPSGGQAALFSAWSGEAGNVRS